MSISNDNLELWLANLPSSGHLRFATGAIADKDGKVSRIIARQLFWDALERVAPELYSEALGHHILTKVWNDRGYFVPPIKGLVRRLGLSIELTEDLVIHLRVAAHCLKTGEAIRNRIIVNEFELGEALDALSPYPRFTLNLREPQSVLSTPVPVYLLLNDDITHETTLSWNPLTESRGHAESRLKETLLAKLKESLDGIERDFTEAGAVSPLTKRRIEHFDWLVRRHVCNESISSIARTTGITDMPTTDRKTVRVAIRSTASLVGITLHTHGEDDRPTNSG